MIAHYTITARLNEKFDSLVHNLTEEGIDDIRKAKIQQERQHIEETKDPAALVEFMRKGHDIFNQNLLCEKILQDQEQTMPLLLKRYRTCALDQFIDAATAVLATGEKKYAQQLRDIYADIRDPFAVPAWCLECRKWTRRSLFCSMNMRGFSKNTLKKLTSSTLFWHCIFYTGNIDL